MSSKFFKIFKYMLENKHNFDRTCQHTYCSFEIKILFVMLYLSLKLTCLALNKLQNSDKII
jgi:hypothetical protein